MTNAVRFIAVQRIANIVLTRVAREPRVAHAHAIFAFAVGTVSAI